jgi:hypothetical protein
VRADPSGHDEGIHAPLTCPIIVLPDADFHESVEAVESLGRNVVARNLENPALETTGAGFLVKRAKNLPAPSRAALGRSGGDRQELSV